MELPHLTPTHHRHDVFIIQELNGPSNRSRATGLKSLRRINTTRELKKNRI